MIPRSKQPSPTRILSSSADDDLCISYARIHLPSAWQEEVHWNLTELNDASRKPRLESNLSQYALISLARVLFAQRFQQIDLLQKGLNLYSQVLSAVNEALGKPECTQRLQILDAVVALRAFDVSQKYLVIAKPQSMFILVGRCYPPLKLELTASCAHWIWAVLLSYNFTIFVAFANFSLSPLFHAMKAHGYNIHLELSNCSNFVVQVRIFLKLHVSHSIEQDHSS